MLKKYFNGLLLLTAIVLLHSCQKNIENFVINPGQSGVDTVWQISVPANAPIISLKNELKINKTTDSFSYNNTGIVFSSGNLSLGIPSNGLATANGLFPTGFVSRQSLLLQKRGDFIMMDMPTVSNNRLLEAFGAFFLDLRNNQQPLVVTTGNKLDVKYTATPIVGNTKIYNISNSNNFNWEINTDTAFNFSTITNTGYDVKTNTLQWLLNAQLVDTVGVQQTALSIKLPSNYTNTNTAVFISFNDAITIAPTTANINNRVFVSGSLPVNRPVTIIVLSKQAGDYYFGLQQTNTAIATSGTGTQEVILTPVRRSIDNIKGFLNSL